MLQARFVRTYEDLVAGVVPNSLYPGRHCAGHNHVEQLSRWHAAIEKKHGRDIVQALAERRRAVTSGQMIRQIEGRAKTRARCHWHALGRSGLSRPLLPLSDPNAFPMPRCSARPREPRLSLDFLTATARLVSPA